MRFFAKADYPFLSWRRQAYLLSAALLALGIGAMVYNAASIGSWLNYGVDFSGGTLVQVDFQEEVTVDQIRGINSSWEITRFGDASANEFIIRMRSFSDDLEADATELVANQLEPVFGEGTFQILRTEAVGPKVGAELQQRALLAILISFVLTLAYLAIRFEWRFGVASLVPTTHDILLTLGVLALLRSEISVGTVAAFLTIVGYSLNDTIIIFDRIRENIGKPTRGRTFGQIIDRSINETLPRTVLTTGTTLATLASLYLFGGAVIRPFALVLFLGIAIGTYSSIFVAAPALYAIEKKWPPRDKKTGSASNPALRRETAAV
jgi:preprotein translocase subunit SecF